ncbi:MAG TPA: PhzF family phenazine biosynthesis protein [Anaerolineaceae bacterium]|nr:PhzF family phenazine biosynthesis protein [Anaerolineaceae bacterium]
MKTLPIYQVDAFTSDIFHGNPAAVCLLEKEMPDSWLQAVAAEMNLSETAFLLKGDEDYQLRWFTPKVEVDLCGHATLASAHVLFSTGRAAAGQEVRFHTRSGILSAVENDGWITLNFPSRPVRTVAEPEGLKEALGLLPRYIGMGEDLLVEVTNERLVRECTPDFARLKQIPVRGVILTARADTDGVDFVSRFFGPQVGINEDPVTGSAHTSLAPYWSEKLGKTDFTAWQISARGGVLKVSLLGDRVAISGQAVMVMQGELLAGE